VKDMHGKISSRKLFLQQVHSVAAYAVVFLYRPYNRPTRYASNNSVDTQILLYRQLSVAGWQYESFSTVPCTGLYMQHGLHRGFHVEKATISEYRFLKGSNYYVQFR